VSFPDDLDEKEDVAYDDCKIPLDNSFIYNDVCSRSTSTSTIEMSRNYKILGSPRKHGLET
jgi:hypothetical protein